MWSFRKKTNSNSVGRQGPILEYVTYLAETSAWSGDTMYFPTVDFSTLPDFVSGTSRALILKRTTDLESASKIEWETVDWTGKKSKIDFWRLEKFSQDRSKCGASKKSHNFIPPIDSKWSETCSWLDSRWLILDKKNFVKFHRIAPSVELQKKN